MARGAPAPREPQLREELLDARERLPKVARDRQRPRRGGRLAHARLQPAYAICHPLARGEAEWGEDRFERQREGARSHLSS